MRRAGRPHLDDRPEAAIRRPGCGLLVIAWCAAPAGAEPVFFERQVGPLLRKHCFVCHSGPRAQAGLDLSSHEAVLAGGANGTAVVPGEANARLLVRKVSDMKMPPNSALARADVEVLRRWEDKGGKWGDARLITAVPSDGGWVGPDRWSHQPIRRPNVPRPAEPFWSANAVDVFIRAVLERKLLRPNPEADRRTLIRGVTLDVTGLWPRWAEVEGF